METYAHCVELFKEADKDNSDSLTRKELEESLKKYGYEGTDFQAKFDKLDTSKDGLISFTEYMEGMKGVELKCHKEAVMRKAFKACDVDGNGKIDREEMKGVIKRLSLNPEDIDFLMKAMDEDNSGDISIEEFIKSVGPHLGK